MDWNTEKVCQSLEPRVCPCFSRDNSRPILLTVGQIWDWRTMSWSLANASLAYFHAYEDTVKTEGDATLEQIGSYAGPLPFMGDSHLRPDGFGLLDTMLMPISSPKYSHFNGSLEGSSYVEKSPSSVWLPSLGLLASS